MISAGLYNSQTIYMTRIYITARYLCVLYDLHDRIRSYWRDYREHLIQKLMGYCFGWRLVGFRFMEVQYAASVAEKPVILYSVISSWIMACIFCLLKRRRLGPLRCHTQKDNVVLFLLSDALEWSSLEYIFETQNETYYHYYHGITRLLLSFTLRLRSYQNRELIQTWFKRDPQQSYEVRHTCYHNIIFAREVYFKLN